MSKYYIYLFKISARTSRSLNTHGKFVTQNLKSNSKFYQNYNFRMVKEVAAITGGTSGLGTACVERFSRDGYEVSITSS